MKAVVLRPVASVAFLATLVVGCVSDPDYDIKDFDSIDTDMNVFENGIEIPLGHTEPITVENALKMADSKDLDSFLKADSDGNYAFSTEGEYNLGEVISDLHLDKLRSIDGFSYSKVLEYAIGGSGQTGMIDVPMSTANGDANHKFTGDVVAWVKTGPFDPDEDFHQTINFEDENVVFIGSKTVSEIPQQVKSLDNITFDGVNALLEIKFSGLPVLNGKFYLKETEILIPEFLVGEWGTNIIRLDDEIEVTEGAVISRKLPLTAMKNINLDGVEEVKSKIKMTSTLYSPKPSVDISTLTGNLSVSVKIGVGNGSQAEASGRIAISKAEVRVGYDVEQKRSITFGNIPSELQGDGVTLALNPQLHLELNTNFGAPVKGDIILTPIVRGKTLDPVVVKGLELPFSENWTRTEEKRYVIGSNVSPTEGEILIPADLSPLLNRVPDSIDVCIKARIDESGSSIVYPSANYVCGMKYFMKVPISFGENFSFNQNADISIAASVNDFLKCVDIVKLDGICRSTLPVDTQIEVVLLDSQEHVIELKEPAKFLIQKSADGKTVKEGPLNLLLAFRDPENVNLSTLRFKINIKASKDVNINKDQYLQINGLKLALPKGIKLDLSK